MQLASVNLGQVKTIAHGKKRFSTGICKRPVTAPVFLGEMGARDDAIADLEHMAGLDQAIYAYSADDYDWWRVLNQGHVQVDDTVTLVENDTAIVSILNLFRFSYDVKHDAEELCRFLPAPIAERFRTKIESKLENLQRASD